MIDSEERRSKIPDHLKAQIYKIGDSFSAEQMLLVDLADRDKAATFSAIEIDGQVAGYELEMEGKFSKGKRKYTMLGAEFLQDYRYSILEALRLLYGTVERFPDFVQLIGDEPTPLNAELMLALEEDPNMASISADFAYKGRSFVVSSWAGDGAVIKQCYGAYKQFELDAHADFGYWQRYEVLNTQHNGKEPENPKSGFMINELIDLTGVAGGILVPDLADYSLARRSNDGDLMPGNLVHKHILLPKGASIELFGPQMNRLSTMYNFKYSLQVLDNGVPDTASLVHRVTPEVAAEMNLNPDDSRVIEKARERVKEVRSSALRDNRAVYYTTVLVDSEARLNEWKEEDESVQHE